MSDAGRAVNVEGRVVTDEDHEIDGDGREIEAMLRLDRGVGRERGDETLHETTIRHAVRTEG